LTNKAPALWLIAILFAVFTVVTSLLPSLMAAGPVGIVTTVLLVAFALVHGVSTYGWRTMIWFVVVCLLVSNIAENLSILTGFPFGHYHYTDVLGPKIFLVPVTIGGAYFGAGYLSWTISLVLLERRGRAVDGFSRWATPLVASMLMTSWDFIFDPGASTVNHYWIWEQGGGFFGVPFENYVGWLLTVFVFYAIFAGYVAGKPVPTPSPRIAWALAIAMYALLGVRYVLTYFALPENPRFVDAAGHAWMRADIYETAALAAIFTIFAFSILAALRLADTPDAT